MQISVDQRFLWEPFQGMSFLSGVLVNINLINQHTWSGGDGAVLEKGVIEKKEISVALNFPLWFNFNDFPFGFFVCCGSSVWRPAVQ